MGGGGVTLSNNETAVIIIEILTKLENGDYMEVVDWEQRSWYWGRTYIYDCPLVAYRGSSCLSPKEVQDEWRRVMSEHRVDGKWKNGDTIIYNPDWTVKEWIKGPAHKNH